ncbi:MAG: nuclease domain-containing protein [Pikeienuella sp.]
MFVSPDLRKFAKGKECQMKSAWCNWNWETTVLCHSRRETGTGTAQKPHDFWAYHGCSDCHAHEREIMTSDLYGAIWRTQKAVYAHFGTLTP